MNIFTGSWPAARLRRLLNIWFTETRWGKKLVWALAIGPIQQRHKLRNNSGKGVVQHFLHAVSEALTSQRVSKHENLFMTVAAIKSRIFFYISHVLKGDFAPDVVLSSAKEYNLSWSACKRLFANSQRPLIWWPWVCVTALLAFLHHYKICLALILH